jgi:hypothetical protein
MHCTRIKGERYAFLLSYDSPLQATILRRILIKEDESKKRRAHANIGVANWPIILLQISKGAE